MRDRDEAARLADTLATEHLHIECTEPEEMLAKIRCAGAAFVGQYTPVALGDYVAGPSHVLPTGGTARAFSGLSVYDFLKRTSVIRYTREDLARDAATLKALAEAEGLTAHWRSVEMRLAEEE